MSAGEACLLGEEGAEKEVWSFFFCRSGVPSRMKDNSIDELTLKLGECTR